MLQEKIGERKAVLKPGCDTEAYFNRNRTREAAIDSYRLAILRAKVEAWHEQPYALYKIGAYALKIAKIMKDSALDHREQLREALKYYEEAFSASNCPSEEVEMQVIYTIVALYLKLENQKKANSFIAVFNNLLATRKLEMQSDPKLNTTLITRWMDKARMLWEDRDSKDLFANE
jgi:tetratricopeptide (TPR) repeat protein